MPPHPEIPELLERYMEDSCRSEQWITVQEIRTYFRMDKSDGPGIIPVNPVNMLYYSGYTV